MASMAKQVSGQPAIIAEPAPHEYEKHVPRAPESPMELVYRLHGPALHRFLVRITLGDRREAEDLLQETLLRAWRYMQSNACDAAQIRPWLYTVARRLAIDAARARRARPSEVILTDLGTLPSTRDDIERSIVALTVRQGLMELSPDHRRVLVEVYYHGRSAREAAAILSIPEGTVKSRLFYALRALAAATGQTEAARLARSRERVPSAIG
jgi:RNA polymerase sigma-70 factor (ECF subfamily)